jgi:hypothetical protein
MDPPLRISTPKPKKENDEYSEEDYEEHYHYKTDYTSMSKTSKTSTSVDTIIHTNPASEMSPLELNPKDTATSNNQPIPSNQDHNPNQDIPLKPSSNCCRSCDCIRVYFNNLCNKFYIFCLELD